MVWCTSLRHYPVFATKLHAQEKKKKQETQDSINQETRKKTSSLWIIFSAKIPSDFRTKAQNVPLRLRRAQNWIRPNRPERTVEKDGKKKRHCPVNKKDGFDSNQIILSLDQTTPHPFLVVGFRNCVATAGIATSKNLVGLFHVP